MPMNHRSQTEGNFGNRDRMFRTLTDLRGRMPRGAKDNGGARQRQAPPEVTNAESFYYVKQMNSHTPMVVVMTDGEVIRGWIEWYDRNCLKVNRDGAPNLLIQKHCIKYLFKQEEE